MHLHFVSDKANQLIDFFIRMFSLKCHKVVENLTKITQEFILIPVNGIHYFPTKYARYICTIKNRTVMLRTCKTAWQFLFVEESNEVVKKQRAKFCSQIL